MYCYDLNAGRVARSGLNIPKFNIFNPRGIFSINVPSDIQRFLIETAVRIPKLDGPEHISVLDLVREFSVIDRIPAGSNVYVYGFFFFQITIVCFLLTFFFFITPCTTTQQRDVAIVVFHCPARSKYFGVRQGHCFVELRKDTVHDDISSITLVRNNLSFKTKLNGHQLKCLKSHFFCFFTPYF